jgi:ABC-type glutathione transport system ATPase component
MTEPTPLLSVAGLSGRRAGQTLLDDVSFSIAAGERVALWGPSGAGKTVLLRAIVGLWPPRTAVDGRVAWRGTEHPAADTVALAARRGGAIGLVPQDAAGSLDPVARVEAQLHAVTMRHGSGLAAAELLALVELDAAVGRAFPHQLSGGMARRVALALALAARPSLLLADEPTASLDSVTATAILRNLFDAATARELALVIVSHDLPRLARHCPRTIVLLDGRIALDATTPAVLESELMPVRALVDACRSSPGKAPA